MASARVDWIERQIEVWNAGDFDAFMEAIGDDFEFRPDPSFPDAGAYTGAELRKWLREWADTWQGNRFEALDITDHGHSVTVDSRWHLAAKGSGDAVPVGDFTMVFWFDDQDHPVRMAAFFERDRALEAARAGPG